MTFNLRKGKNCINRTLFSFPTPIKEFPTLIYIPLARQYRSNTSLKCLASLCKPSQNRRISSTNKRWDKNNLVPTFIPLKSPNFLASKRYLLSPSATNKNNKEERGKPYLKPLTGLNIFQQNKRNQWNEIHNPINKV